MHAGPERGPGPRRASLDSRPRFAPPRLAAGPRARPLRAASVSGLRVANAPISHAATSSSASRDNSILVRSVSKLHFFLDLGVLHMNERARCHHLSRKPVGFETVLWYRVDG